MEDLTTAGLHSMRCPFCEVYELERSGDDSARCTSCGDSLDAELLGMLREIRALPDALGAHACECGPPRDAKVARRGVPLPGLRRGGHSQVIPF